MPGEADPLVGQDAENETAIDEPVEAHTVEGPPTKKRKRIAKPISEKKFDCKHEGCGKSYSRAEHLYRHQLNHTPKNIYRCDFPDCNRYFVRQDLCVRHRERHSTQGSQLHKRDTFAKSTTSPIPVSGVTPRWESFASNELPRENMFVKSPTPLKNGHGHANGANLDKSVSSNPTGQHARVPGSTSTNSNDSRFHPPTPQVIQENPRLPVFRSNSNNSSTFSPEQRALNTSWSAPPRADSFGSKPFESPTQNHISPQAHRNSINIMSQGNGYVTQADLPFLSRPANGTSASSAAFAAAVSNGLNAMNTDPMMPFSLMGDQSTGFNNTNYEFPVLGDDYMRSPVAMADDFTAWLFNESQPTPGIVSNAAYNFNFNDTIASQLQSPSLEPMRTLASLNNPNKSTNILGETNAGQYIMSEEKRQQLLDLMQSQFIERPHDAVKKRKDAVFEGDIDADGHILSLRMMHLYLGSYFYHQHAQLPILHKSSFSADKTENLLLLAVLAIGAATMDKAYGTSLTDSAAEFSNFVIWHIRWEIVRDADFRPPTKLWVYQTLLLIEIYEKMYATRALHERSHIFHDTTLTLLRRGSSLLGKSSGESPPSRKDEHGKQNGNENVMNKTEESWSQWITTEATRRVAFGAFVVDSIHATMFGHSSKILPHEMRLPLPCDEALWSATSPAEAGRVQSALQSNGVKPIMFDVGLKLTLTGQRVRTNSFGRTILMAGLLSVAWHMNQRDLQITSLGAQNASSFGGRDKWKSLLLRAFDNWKRDFDEALAEATPPDPDRTTTQGRLSLLRPVDDENIFESRTVLHHLAHIAAHVDVLDCQVFAGADRLLGRSVSPKDYSVIKDKINKWAKKASARDAAFYALKFLAQVLLPPFNDNNPYGHASPILPQAFEHNQYMARDDFLMNRPWVLYLSALVVWCYGFALEGAISPPPKEDDLASYEQREADMRDFLERVGGIRAPDDLEDVADKNRCLGLLLILKDSFTLTRWELTHEAAHLLGNCIEKLKGAEKSVDLTAAIVLNGTMQRSGVDSGIGPR